VTVLGLSSITGEVIMVRSRASFLLLAVLLVAATPGPTPAQDHGQAPSKAEAGKKPPPNIFELRLDLTIWTIVVFVCLLLLLKRVAWKPMLEGLQRREERIRSDLEEAQRTRDEAKRLSAALQQKMDQANQEVQRLLEQARVNAQQTTEAMFAEARTEMKTERERLHKDIDLARDQALEQIWNQAAQLAALVSSRAVRRQLTPDDHRGLVDEALADLRRLGKDGQQGVA
jgi:F-type H+-transporting ATPase subunit b